MTGKFKVAESGGKVGAFNPYVVLASCWAISALVYVNRMSLTAVFPAVKEEFALSNAQVGAVLSVLMAAYALSMFPSGHLAARLGLRRVVTICLLGVAATGALVTLANGYIALLAGFAVFGFFLGMYIPSGISIITSIFPGKRRGRALGIHETAPPVGNVIGLVTAGVLVGLVGWRFPYLLYVLPAMVVLAFFLTIYRGVGDAGTEAARNRLEARKTGAEPLSVSLRRGRLWIYLIPFCVNTFSLYGMYTLLPLYLTEAFGVTILSAALTLALCRVGAIFGSFTTGTLSDRFPAGIMILALLSANCILLLVFVTLQLDASMIAVLMGLGFISSSFFPLTFKLIADRTPQASRPPVTGFFMTTSLLLGGALAPLILGVAADVWDHRTAYLIPAIMSGAGALFVVATTRFRD